MHVARGVPPGLGEVPSSRWVKDGHVAVQPAPHPRLGLSCLPQMKLRPCGSRPSSLPRPGDQPAFHLQECDCSGTAGPWNHAVTPSPWPAYFTQRDVLEVPLCAGMWETPRPRRPSDTPPWARTAPPCQPACRGHPRGSLRAQLKKRRRRHQPGSRRSVLRRVPQRWGSHGHSVFGFQGPAKLLCMAAVAFCPS